MTDQEYNAEYSQKRFGEKLKRDRETRCEFGKPRKRFLAYMEELTGYRMSESALKKFEFGLQLPKADQLAALAVSIYGEQWESGLAMLVRSGMDACFQFEADKLSLQGALGDLGKELSDEHIEVLRKVRDSTLY